MSSSITEEDATQNDIESQNDPAEFYGVRDGTLFLIDASPEMFSNNEKGVPYFVSCIEEYIFILKQKLVWNRQDWMGLVLFGTEIWDMDPEIKNILTLQKVTLINKNKLQEAEKIRDQKWKDYKSMSSSKSYPIHDALWHAAQSFSSIKVIMSARRVILYTCHDVPPLTDENEKHRVRAKAATFNDIGILLHVVGLGEKWDIGPFYKDLEMLSRNITLEDYQRISYKDLVQQVKRPSRHMAKLPWRLGKDVIINVDISNLCVKTEDLKKIKMRSEDNAPLVSHTYYQRKDFDMEEEEEDEEEDDEKINLPISDTDLRKMQEYGGEQIYFTVDELKNLTNIYNKGLDMIAVKPSYCDPMYHCQAPYFVSCNKNSSKSEKSLFAALLDRCEKRNLMITCRVTLRKTSGTFLYNMMPVVTDGGFYLYQVPYSDNVYKFTEEMYEYAYGNKEPPINEKAVELFEQIIKQSLVVYNPEKFPNPKLQVKLQNLETIALKMERRSPPPDETLPMEDLLRERIGDLTKQVNDLLKKDEPECVPPKNKRSKTFKEKTSTKDDDNDVLGLVEQNQLHQCKVTQLRLFLRDAGLSTAGSKLELIHRLYSHYEKK